MASLASLLLLHKSAGLFSDSVVNPWSSIIDIPVWIPDWTTQKVKTYLKYCIKKIKRGNDSQINIYERGLI